MHSEAKPQSATTSSSSAGPITMAPAAESIA
jgi:hypothetical protein